MPDITMCQNRKCPKAMSCYRYVAIPDEQQSYALFEWVKGKCAAYIPVDWQDKIKQRKP